MKYLTKLRHTGNISNQIQFKHTVIMTIPLLAVSSVLVKGHAGRGTRWFRVTNNLY
jgi:hypothetical protein